ncbi:JNK-interacting protein-like [Heterodontus francisci]|uniref:JNK-interacting protein-like n=1 Tax=Heterodontus francisci TaxID=7792 RepID=UPI00355B7FAE
MSEMEGSETFLSDGTEADGASGLADCSEVVSSLAGGLYTELEQLILAHGEGAVTGLVPLAVTALETLETLYAETRARAADVARAREEAERVLTHYERERAERKRTEEVRSPSGRVEGETRTPEFVRPRRAEEPGESG